MANVLYDKARTAFAVAQLNWTSDTIKVALVTSGYTVNLSTHQYVSDLGANIVARSTLLLTPTVTAGIVDAADITIPAVTGSTIAYLVIYKDTGNDASSPLIAYLDTVTGLPMAPAGGDIIISWDNTTNKIFKL
jgi:hypothetical protein